MLPREVVVLGVKEHPVFARGITGNKAAEFFTIVTAHDKRAN